MTNDSSAATECTSAVDDIAHDHKAVVDDNTSARQQNAQHVVRMLSTMACSEIIDMYEEVRILSFEPKT